MLATSRRYVYTLESGQPTVALRRLLAALDALGMHVSVQAPPTASGRRVKPPVGGTPSAGKGAPVTGRRSGRLGRLLRRPGR